MVTKNLKIEGEESQIEHAALLVDCGVEELYQGSLAFSLGCELDTQETAGTRFVHN